MASVDRVNKFLTPLRTRGSAVIMDELPIASQPAVIARAAPIAATLASAPLGILYLGTEDGTCLDRANAYRRLGHRIDHIDVRRLLPATGWVDRITWQAGGQVFAPIVRKRLGPILADKRYDLCHVDGGEWISPSVVGILRQHAGKVISYNVDDPLGPRDKQRFAAYRAALPHYDHVFVVRDPNVEEARARGARNVTRIWRSADEVAHAPRRLADEDHARWDCEVLFLGTWMPERGPFLLRLAELGVPLTIRGNNWQKAPDWSGLSRYWKGPGVTGDDYAKAIQCARVNLGLTSKGNRDLHTQRSLEIPALGALLCGERTEDHLKLYRDGEEAVLWSTAEECAEICRILLVEERTRLRIAERGRARLLRNGHLNERVMDYLISLSGAAAVSKTVA
jgi:spore maturation protein CgeB